MSEVAEVLPRLNVPAMAELMLVAKRARLLAVKHMHNCYRDTPISGQPEDERDYAAAQRMAEEELFLTAEIRALENYKIEESF